MDNHTLQSTKIIYAVIAYNLSVQKKHQNVILKTALNIMANKRLWFLKKVTMLDSKLIKEKINSLFIIYADFKSILVLEDNGKQNTEESYINKY